MEQAVGDFEIVDACGFEAWIANLPVDEARVYLDELSELVSKQDLLIVSPLVPFTGGRQKLRLGSAELELMARTRQGGDSPGMLIFLVHLQHEE